MTDYYVGMENVMIPFEANDDNHAIECAKNLIAGDDYTGFVILNNETGRFFDLSGQTL